MITSLYGYAYTTHCRGVMVIWAEKSRRGLCWDTMRKAQELMLAKLLHSPNNTLHHRSLIINHWYDAIHSIISCNHKSHVWPHDLCTVLRQRLHYTCNTTHIIKLKLTFSIILETHRIDLWTEWDRYHIFDSTHLSNKNNNNNNYYSNSQFIHSQS